MTGPLATWAGQTGRRMRMAVLAASQSSGVFSLVRDSRWRRRRLLVLGYHGIGIEDEHEWNPELYMAPAVFRRRLERLRDGGYRVLRLADALARLSADELPERSVAITFDDGNYNFYREAYPLLREFGFPATVYLTTYYCEFNRPIYNLAAGYALWKTPLRGWHPRAVGGFTGDYELPADRDKAWLALMRHADRRRFSGRDKDAFLDELLHSLQVDAQRIRRQRLFHLMNPEEVAELAGMGIDFEMHTHRHRTPRDPGFIERDFADNLACIERLTGRRPTHFCYPNGDYKELLVECLRRHDMLSATTCDPDLASADTPMLHLPRFIDTMKIPDLVFESWLSGVQPWISRRRSYAP